MAGAQTSANSNTQVGISATYMLSKKFAVEILAATPFSHDLKGKGSLDGADIGSALQLPPTISAQYYFMDNDSKVQPYVGAGINYTVFFDEKTGDTVEALGYDSLSLDNSIGLAAQAGLDYQINENRGINASAMYAKIGTTATLKGDSGATLTVDYNLDPMVYRLNAVHKFSVSTEEN